MSDRLVQGQVTAEFPSREGQETVAQGRDVGSPPRPASEAPDCNKEGQVVASGPEGQPVNNRPYPQHRPYPKYTVDAGK